MSQRPRVSSLPVHSPDAVLNAELYRSHELVCWHLLVRNLRIVRNVAVNK